MKKFLLVLILAACTSDPVAPKFPSQPHVPTGEASIEIITQQCPEGRALAMVVWDLPTGTRWSARFYIQQPNMYHPEPADFSTGTASGKITGCIYAYGDKVSADIWTDTERRQLEAVTVRP